MVSDRLRRVSRKVKLVTPILEPNISKTAGFRDCSKGLPIGYMAYGDQMVM